MPEAKNIKTFSSLQLVSEFKNHLITPEIRYRIVFEFIELKKIMQTVLTKR